MGDGTKLGRSAYRKLVEEDRAWLATMALAFGLAVAPGGKR